MTFLSDFGLSDEYVAVCKAVIRSIAADVEISDISHLIPPFGVRQGAQVLAEAAGYFKDAVHLAVVDPGVGSSRRALVLGAADGSQLVGPDNGLLLPAASRLGGIRAAFEIANPALGLPAPSQTFHGRDIFAPAAAHLALGVPVEEFGPRLAVESLVELPQAGVESLGTRLRGEVLQVDRFGNLQTSFRPADLQPLGIGLGGRVDLAVAGAVIRATVRRSYSYGAVGEVQLVEDSHGNLALCVNRGSAAELFKDAGPGTTVLLALPGSAGLEEQA